MSYTKKNKNNIDDNKFLKLISENNSLNNLILELDKNKNDVIRKLKKMAVKMFKENKSKNEIKKKIKFLTDEQLDKIINHINKKKQKEIDENSLKSLKSIKSLKSTESPKTTKTTKTTKNIKTNSKKIFDMLNAIDNKINMLIENFKNNKNENINNKVINKKELSDESDSEDDNQNEDTDSIIKMINTNRTKKWHS